MKLPRVPRWLKIVAVLAAIVVVCIGIPAWLWIMSDIEPQDDSDLAIERRTVAAADNGFELVNFGEEDRYALSNDIGSSGFDENWNAEEGATFVGRASPYLKKLDECLARPEFQVHAITGTEVRVHYLIVWRRLSDALAFRARLALDDDRPADALADAFRQLEFGRRITRSEGLLITFMFGTALTEVGFRMLRETASRAAVRAEELAVIVRRLATYEPSADEFLRILKLEYAFDCRAIDDAVAGRVDEGVDDLSMSSALCLPNETKHLVAEVIRGALRRAAAPPHDRGERGPMLETMELFGLQVPTTLRNLPGRTAAEMVAQSLDHCMSTLNLRLVSYRATLAFLALRAYHAEHGDLPESLDALVPNFLDAVPEDPFDGKPLRYSKSAKRIWSIGADGVDAGGLDIAPGESDELGDDDEPTLPIRFGGE